MSMGIGVNLSDPRTAAAAARFHQLLQNGVPKEQASQIMQQEGGMIPIANLAIAYQQLQDAAKRSQVPPPSPGTVAQHIFAADAQMHGQMPPQQMPPQMPPQQMPSQQMPPQMPPQQMPPQQPDPRMAGVANLPNTMGATGYKGGGIVAFNGEDDEQQVFADMDDPAYTLGKLSDSRKSSRSLKTAEPSDIPQLGIYGATNRPSQETIDASVTNALFGAPGQESQFGQDVAGAVGAYKASVGSNITATAARNQLEAQLAGLRNQRLNVAGAFGSYFTSMTPTEREKRKAELSNIDSKIEATQEKLSAFRGRETPAAAPIAAAANPAAAAAVAPAAANPAAPGATSGGPAAPPLDINKILGAGDDTGYGRISARVGLGSFPHATAHTSALDTMIAEGSPKRPKNVGAELSQIIKYNKRYGIGDSTKKYSDYLDKRKEDMAEEFKKDRRLSIAQAGFAMAQAASQPGQAGNAFSKFLSSASVGGAQAAQGIMALHQQQRKSEQALAEDRLKLAQSDELRKAGYLRDATMLAREGMRDYTQNMHYYLGLGAEKDKLETEVDRTNATVAGEMRRAQITAEAGGNRVPYEQVWRDKAARLGEYIASHPNDPHIKQLKEMQTGMQTELSNYYENSTPKGFGYGEAARDKIGAEVDKFIQSASGMMPYTARVEVLKKGGMDELSASIQAREELIDNFMHVRGLGGSGGGSAVAPSGGWGTAKVVGGGA